MNEFKYKNIVITGAASGIGKHFAKLFAKLGAGLILIDKNNEKLASTVAECSKQTNKVHGYASDISVVNNIITTIEKAKLEFPSVDLLINCAGVGVIHDDILDISEEKWDYVLDINLKAVYFMNQAIAKWMIASKNPGKIINISSAAAYHTTKQRSVYSISKIGVESLTRSFALSLAEMGIQVNCIAPGFVETELSSAYLKTDRAKSELEHIPMHRPAQLQELEGVLLLLATSDSSYITGTTIQIDGGCAVNKL